MTWPPGLGQSNRSRCLLSLGQPGRILPGGRLPGAAWYWLSPSWSPLLGRSKEGSSESRQDGSIPSYSQQAHSPANDKCQCQLPQSKSFHCCFLLGHLLCCVPAPDSGKKFKYLPPITVLGQGTQGPTPQELHLSSGLCPECYSSTWHLL